MKKVTLTFPSKDALWEFMIAAKPDFIQIKVPEKTITCICSEEHIALAIEKFKATVKN